MSAVLKGTVIGDSNQADILATNDSGCQNVSYSQRQHFL